MGRAAAGLMLGDEPDGAPDDSALYDSPLLAAARAGCARVLSRLFAFFATLKWPDGQPLNAYDTTGWKPVHLASLCGSVESVRVLVEEAGADLESRAEHNSWTPLHVAAAQNNLPLISYLIGKNVNVNTQDVVGNTPLIITCCNGFKEAVSLLLDAHADASLMTTSSTETALFMACRNGHEGILQLLLERTGKNEVNTESLNWATPLHVACAIRSYGTVKLLLDNGAKVNAQKKDGYTALHIAAIKGEVEIMKLLIAKGADINLRTKFGTTPLHEACFACNVDVVRLLVAGGADVNSIDNDGQTPLHRACSARVDNVEVVNALIELGANVNACDSGEATPLHIAACTNSAASAERVQYLLEHGADLTILNVQEWSSLHIAYSAAPEGNRVTAEIEEYAREHCPEFLTTFDRHKPRTIGGPRAARRTPQLTLDFERRWRVLDGEVSLEGIAKKIKAGKCNKIIVMCGAGISVSAGIPDFRSPNGVRSVTCRVNIPSPPSNTRLVNDTAHDGKCVRCALHG
eukprot:TRINITY_DN3544_c0_g1_i2.p1 TRINITY_DN3544_c0_g1~~TRINITY_DN3544_c0_g1_i2.p1  ORF type:complete len:606 (+),score=138.46 TRINITY_DN3544_c0_g1_i2:264-1820(+)